MIRRMLALDGVLAIVQFRDDGAYVDGYGSLPQEQLPQLAQFAHDYKRIVQGNVDQLSMFAGIAGWTPPAGWMVRGSRMSVCGVGNLACIVDHREAGLNEVLRELDDISRY